LLDIHIVKPGKIYGRPAYYVGGKLFASLYMERVCVKLPESYKNELLKREGIVPFEPMGRKMREWVQINRKKSADYIKDREIFDESIKYVASIAGIKLDKK